MTGHGSAQGLSSHERQFGDARNDIGEIGLVLLPQGQSTFFRRSPSWKTTQGRPRTGREFTPQTYRVAAAPGRHAGSAGCGPCVFHTS
jgi:hypothetical protein